MYFCYVDKVLFKILIVVFDFKLWKDYNLMLYKLIIIIKIVGRFKVFGLKEINLMFIWYVYINNILNIIFVVILYWYCYFCCFFVFWL